MKSKKSWMILALAITLVLATTTGGWAYLVDTGPGPGPGFGWSWLLRESNSNFTYQAAEFTLSQESTITSIEGWIQTKTAGSLRAVIYNDGGELPGTTVLGSQDFSLLTPESTPTWHGTLGLNWTLAAGTYWVAFEVPNPGFSGYMYSAYYNPFWLPANPLGNEASANQWWPAYYAADANNIGVRIDGVPLPGAVWLLGSGLVGLAAWRRRKINK